MSRKIECGYKISGYLLIGVLLLLPVSCAVPQGGAGGSLMGTGKRGQQAPSDAPPDYQQDQRRK